MAQMSDNEYLFTSESVTEGHPDKVADQISDGVLDAVMAEDPLGRVACETLVNTGLVVVSGEISTETYVDIQQVARETIRKIGYVDAELGFSADSCAVLNAIDKQSPDIAQGVNQAYETRTDASDDDELDVAGAGDQGMMFGYATNETASLMPVPISIAHQLAKQLAAVRHDGSLDYLRPDGKTQVSVRYVDGRPVAIEKLLISTQHADSATQKQITDDLWELVVLPVLPAGMYDANALRRDFLVNPTGRFVIGGPVGDCGLTGRKIIVDTYGGMARHGGGAFSGKDPSKVDRSAAYAARWVAKNIVAAGLADRCELQVAYAIGVAHPVSLMVETFGTEKIGRGRIAALVSEHFDMRPGAFREELRPPPPDLPEDRRLRPLRPRRRRLHLGADRQGRRAPRSRRAGRVGPGLSGPRAGTGGEGRSVGRQFAIKPRGDRQADRTRRPDRSTVQRLDRLDPADRPADEDLGRPQEAGRRDLLDRDAEPEPPGDRDDRGPRDAGEQAPVDRRCAQPAVGVDDEDVRPRPLEQRAVEVAQRRLRGRDAPLERLDQATVGPLVGAQATGDRHRPQGDRRPPIGDR